MAEEPETTTVEVKMDTWAALDRRKERGDSFDDVIRKLIDATGVGVGELAGPHPDVETGEIEPIGDDEEADKGCAKWDLINGEECDEEPAYRQQYRLSEGDEWDVWYFCEEHAEA